MVQIALPATVRPAARPHSAGSAARSAVAVPHLRIVGADAEPSSGHTTDVPRRVHLTRRGRFLLIGLPVMLGATALLVLLGVFTAPAMAAGAGAASPVDAAAVTVVEGETLWALAAEFAPHRDPREIIAEIVELNNLSGPTLVPGQELFVPSGR